ncbi:hypothetical protein BDB01DRAFT_786877 [Pilobolus umbonatus]|nr:hypothetical protein BDB01DRAFT_786877 [Pilobolus umbonatus]
MSTHIDHTKNTLLNDNHTIPEVNEDEDSLSANMMRNCSVSSSCCVDIYGQRVSADILVAMLDRPKEMRELVSRNSQFYEVLEHYISETQGQLAWERFQEIVYKPRQKMCDRVWMSYITHYLSHNPVFLTKFKEIVGYTDDEEDDYHNSFQPMNNKSMANGRKGSRRLSTMSVGDVLDYSEDEILDDEAPKIPDGMFSNESQFYDEQFHASGMSPGRRSSYVSFQSQPHPTFFDGNMNKQDESKMGLSSINQVEDDDDHLSDLLDDDDDMEEDSEDKHRHKEIGAGISSTSTDCNLHHYNEIDLIKLRDYPEFQTDLPKTHAAFFRKAKQLLSTASSSHKLSTKIHRNSIMEGFKPSTPVTEMDEPLFQTCEESDEENENGNLINLVCTTRRQQPDDMKWLNDITDLLSGWPGLIDELMGIVHHELEDSNATN